MTQQELADKALLSRTTIVRIENGHIGARLPVIRRLARALKVKPTDLIHPPAATVARASDNRGECSTPSSDQS